MSNFFKKLLLSLTVLTALLLPAAPAFALNPFSQVCNINGSAKTSSAVCASTGGDPLTGKNGIIRKVSVVIATIAGIFAVIVLVMGGIRFITSGGNPEQVSQAKRTIIYAVIGLAAIVLGQTLIMFILSKV